MMRFFAEKSLRKMNARMSTLSDEILAKALHVPSAYGSLPVNWSWSRLDDISQGVFDCPHSTPKLTQEGPFVVRTQDIITGIFRADQAGHVSEETYAERTARIAPMRGDLLYSREGTYFGIAAEVPENTRVCLGQRMVLIRPDNRRLDFRFLRYWLNCEIMAAHIQGYRDGSVAERLNLPTIRSLPILVPPLSEQREIAAILGALDDKIEVNRRMNATLEVMARALFQSWFVDFDPVRAKLDGRKPEGLDDATAALFPSSFQESGNGQIPYGWTLGTIGDVAVCPRRGIQPSAIVPETPYIALEHMPRGSIALSEWSDSTDIASGKSEFRKGEILFGKLRPYFHKVGVAPFDGVCSTDILVLSPKMPGWFGVLLGHTSSDELIQFTDRGSTGTKMPRTSWKDISSFPIILPPYPIAERSTAFVQPLVDRIHTNLQESRRVQAIRDALLPKLLSGQFCKGGPHA
jgi:type I restriction enzyme S subunit